jgi:hypothetical protein
MINQIIWECTVHTHARTQRFKSHFLRHSAGTEFKTEANDHIISGDFTNRLYGYVHTQLADGKASIHGGYIL